MIVLYFIVPQVHVEGICYSMSSSESDVETFVEDIIRLDSLNTDVKHIAFFRSKIDISYTRREENVVLEPLLTEREGLLPTPSGS